MAKILLSVKVIFDASMNVTIAERTDLAAADQTSRVKLLHRICFKDQRYRNLTSIIAKERKV